MQKILLVSLLSLFTSLNAAQLSITQQSVSPHAVDVIIHVRPDEGEAIFKDHITLAIDHPQLVLTAWTTASKPTTVDARNISSTVPAFTEPFTMISRITQRPSSKEPLNNITGAGLHITYLSSKQRNPIQELFTLNFGTQTATAAPDSTPVVETNICTPPVEPLQTPKSFSFLAWSNYLEDIIRATSNFWVRLLLILFLGLFMSFTPCIYPMIPITVGILQGNGQRSFWRNVAHASAYSVGIAITFATLGLIAAASGTIFGSLMASPVVVLLIAILLVYLSGTMFGWYELYIPRFMQQHNHTHQGSVFSSFVFGAISGSIASPCLSPGLALVLCIVASLGSKIMGFFLLFAFGIGLSLPLLVVGIFSSSLSALPRSGMWMMEFKKVFGFLLLGMALYYAKNVLPYAIIVWLLGLLVAAAGVQYLLNMDQASDSKLARRIKSLVGTMLLVLAVLIFVEAYQTTFHTVAIEQETFWDTDYEHARAQAIADHKLLFLDFWAPFCSICTAIDKTLLKDPEVRSALQQFVPAKIELVMTNTTMQALKQNFNIVGLPTFLLIDPTNEKIVQRWGGELYHADKNNFVKELHKLAVQP